jgi:DNA-binding transcriptional regulator PaaX
MSSPDDPATRRYLLEQGHILEALAYGDVLTGTLDHLGRRFGLAPAELRACLRQLASAGWIAVQTEPFGRLTIRLERRSHRAPPPMSGERRRPVPDAWHL